MRFVTSLAELETIYGEASPTSRVKEVGSLTAPYRAFIEASPMLILASAGAEGLDCSPKGDAPGFVRVIDAQTVAIPDRLGNNRINNLRNIVADPRVSVLFLIPGISETLRINGRAAITGDPVLLESFAVRGKAPRTVILVTIDAVYFHCAKAIIRSKLWDPEGRQTRDTVPSSGEMLRCIVEGDFDADQYDRDLPARIQNTLY